MKFNEMIRNIEAISPWYVKCVYYHEIPVKNCWGSITYHKEEVKSLKQATSVSVEVYSKSTITGWYGFHPMASLERCEDPTRTEILWHNAWCASWETVSCDKVIELISKASSGVRKAYG